MPANENDAEHEHQWGPLERSRFASTVHRKCQVDGCKVINALDDDDDEEEGQSDGESRTSDEDRG